jgi:hypothetical protein
MSNLEALLILFGWQTFRHIPRAPDGSAYGPAIFQNQNFLGGLKTESRRASLRLCRQMNCIRCDARLSEDSKGDHIIPSALGGPNGAHNYLPLCGACNSRKGIKDLLVWWRAEGESIDDLPLDVVCAYSRLMFQWLGDRVREPAPAYLERAAAELLASLPSPAHSSALVERAHAESENYFNQVVTA